MEEGGEEEEAGEEEEEGEAEEDVLRPSLANIAVKAVEEVSTSDTTS